MTRVIGAVVAIAVAAVVVLRDDSGDVANDYDPLRSTLDYRAPDGFNAGGRTSQVTEQNEDYEIGDGATGL